MIEGIFLIIIFIFVIGLAYFITKQLAVLGAGRMQSKNMKILETLQLGVNQYIHLVKVGGKTLVIGITKDHISYLCEMDNESINLSDYNVSSDTPSFEKYLKKFTFKKK